MKAIVYYLMDVIFVPALIIYLLYNNLLILFENFCTIITNIHYNLFQCIKRQADRVNKKFGIIIE